MGSRPLPVLVLIPCYALAVILLAWASHELNYDRWIDDADLIYRIETTISPPGAEAVESASAAKPLADILQRSFGESVVNAVSVQYSPSFVKTERTGDSVRVHHAIADPSAISMLGRWSGKLQGTDGVLVSRQLAAQLFGSIDVVGRTIYLNSSDNPKRIDGLLAPARGATHFPIDVFEPSVTPPAPPADLNYWFNLSDYVYVKVANKSAAQQIERSLPQLLDEQLPPVGRGEGAKAPSELIKLRLRSVVDIYLKSTASPSVVPPGNGSVVVIASGLAVLSLLFAAISYNGYAMSRVVQRSSEIGIRKLEGASRHRIFTLIAWVCARDSILAVVAASAFAFVAYSHLMARSGDQAGPQMGMSALAAVLAAGVASVLVNSPMPALAAARAHVLDALRGQIMLGAKRATLRTWLLAIQAAITIFALLVTTSLRSHLADLRKVDNGFDAHGVDIVEHAGRFSGGQDAMERIVSRFSHQGEAVARSSASPAEFVTRRTTVTFPGSPNEYSLVHINGDAALGKVLGLRLRSGAYIRAESKPDDDATEAILTSSAASLVSPGNPAALVGSVLLVPSAKGDGTSKVTIAGIVDDFRFGGPKIELQPTILTNDPIGVEHLLLRTSPAVTEAAQGIVTERIPFGAPIVRSLDGRLSELTKDAESAFHMSLAASLMLIVTAAIGFWGHVKYTIEAARRELAIHRVMGAGPMQMVLVAGVPLVRAVLAASVVGGLLGYFVLTLAASKFEFPVSTHLSHLISSVLIIAMLLTVALLVNSATVSRWRIPQILAADR